MWQNGTATLTPQKFLLEACLDTVKVGRALFFLGREGVVMVEDDGDGHRRCGGREVGNYSRCERDVSCGNGGGRFEEAVAGMAACACSAGVL